MTVMFLFLLEEEDCQLNKGTERVRGGSESPLTHVHTHTHMHTHPRNCDQWKSLSSMNNLQFTVE